MGEPQFTYVSYIAATPQEVWVALTHPEFVRHLLGFRVESDWKPGGPFRLYKPDGRVESEGVVVASDPPRRLAMSWRSAWIGGSYRSLPRAVAAYELEPMGEVVRLTVSELHEEPVNAAYLEGGRDGWPVVVSRLKTLVETGRPLPTPRPQA